jgi:phenylalanyl-tRNA synthetase alpha chain
MLNRIEELQRMTAAFKADSPAAAEEFRIKMLGKKGALTMLFEDFKNLQEGKREAGKLLNSLKTLINDKIAACSHSAGTGAATAIADPTRPASADHAGSRHPIAAMRQRIVSIFARMGFAAAYGGEIEDDYHVFGALNFADDHPARDMQDTFFVQDDAPSANPTLLRTHTSSVQVRTMERQQPPIRVVCPGRVYRNEAISARAHCMFHQVEGLYVDKDVSFADLRQALLCFARELFGERTKIRLRPSYFPFTEPSAEMDVSCSLCAGAGCSVCKGTGWLEIAGCGMVHPNVLRNCGISPDAYSGYAFGMGIERMVMLKYQVRDLRLYFENDVRFLRQFGSAYCL